MTRKAICPVCREERTTSDGALSICERCRDNLRAKLRLNPETADFINCAQGEVLFRETLKLLFPVKAG